MNGCLVSSDCNHGEKKSKYLFTAGVNITGSLVDEKSSNRKLSDTYKLEPINELCEHI